MYKFSGAPSGATKGKKVSFYIPFMRVPVFQKKVLVVFKKVLVVFCKILGVLVVLGSGGFKNLNATLVDIMFTNENLPKIP